MAYIQKRTNKKGVVTYRLKVSLGYENGNQITSSKTFKPDQSLSARQMEQAAQHEAYLFEEEMHQRLQPKSSTFESLCIEYLELVERTANLKTSTIERLKGCKQRVNQTFGKYNIDKIDFRMVQRFVLTLADDGLSTKTQKNYVNLVSNVCKYAVKCGYINRNPCQNIDYVHREPKASVPYSLEEEITIIERLKKTDDLMYQLLFHLLIFTGMRSGEAFGLEWNDIDFDNRLIHIQRTSKYVNSNTGTITSTPKTKSGNRFVQITDDICSMLKRYRFEQNRKRVLYGDMWFESDRIFVQTKSPGKPMNPNSGYTWFKKFCEKEGLPFRGMHAFRHAFATNAIVGAHADIKTVSSILGHKDVTTTMQIYTHAIQKANTLTMNNVAALILDAKSNA